MTCNTNQICKACSLGCHHKHEIEFQDHAEKKLKSKCNESKCFIQAPENETNQKAIQKTENEVDHRPNTSHKKCTRSWVYHKNVFLVIAWKYKSLFNMRYFDILIV